MFKIVSVAGSSIFKAQSSTQQCCDSNFRPKNQHENFTHHELAELFNRNGLSFFFRENRAQISSQSKATSSRKWSKPTWVHPVECLLGWKGGTFFSKPPWDPRDWKNIIQFGWDVVDWILWSFWTQTHWKKNEEGTTRTSWWLNQPNWEILIK